MGTVIKDSWISVIKGQMYGLVQAPTPRDAPDYFSAIIALELKELVVPRVGFICISHEGRKYVYPHTWLESKDGKNIIDISAFKQREKDSVEWFVKPGIIMNETIQFSDGDAVAKNDKIKRIYLAEKPMYFFDKESIDYFLFKMHVIEDYEFDYMRLRVSSRQQLKSLARMLGDANYKKFSRAMEKAH